MVKKPKDVIGIVRWGITHNRPISSKTGKPVRGRKSNPDEFEVTVDYGGRLITYKGIILSQQEVK